jgi:hypothetical protein
MLENKERRGRPKLEIQETPRKYTREFIDDEGVKKIWKYDLDKFPNGPIEVELIYPKDWVSYEDRVKQAKKLEKKLNGKLPKSKMKYLNPTNGKMVSYSRAKTLGIIK